MADTDIPGFDSLSPADQGAIGATLHALQEGFDQRDVSLLTHVYTADADWINAFGTRKQGSAEILDYLEGLFAEPAFDQGKMAGPPEVSMRPLGPDAIIVTLHLRILGQGLADGGTIPVRNNYSLHILQKQPDGHWPVVSELFMDARTDVTWDRTDRDLEPST